MGTFKYRTKATVIFSYILKMIRSNDPIAILKRIRNAWWQISSEYRDVDFFLNLIKEEGADIFVHVFFLSNPGICVTSLRNNCDMMSFKNCNKSKCGNSMENVEWNVFFYYYYYYFQFYLTQHTSINYHLFKWLLGWSHHFMLYTLWPNDSMI